MDQHLGASITLSFSLVVIFAIILYQPDEDPSRLDPAAKTGIGLLAKSEASIRPSLPSPPPPPPPTPGTPLVEPIARSVPLPARPHPRAPETLPANGPEAAALQRPAPEIQARRERGGTLPMATGPRTPAGNGQDTAATSAAPSSPGKAGGRPPHEPFTLAKEGETLRDVALRVYGSPDEVDTLWRLNRDLIGRNDVVLSSGTLLRTP